MCFAIMQGTPGYRPDGSAAEEAITGQEGTVLRLLIMHRGHPLTKDEIARHLTRAGRRTVLPSSVPGYIARLRNRVGQGCVRSRAGYYSAVDPADVDAFVFERLIREHGVCDIEELRAVAGPAFDVAG
jgi:hypothetical protein